MLTLSVGDEVVRSLGEHAGMVGEVLCVTHLRHGAECEALVRWHDGTESEVDADLLTTLTDDSAIGAIETSEREKRTVHMRHSAQLERFLLEECSEAGGTAQLVVRGDDWCVVLHKETGK